MCPISFAFKRIHLSALRVYRKQIDERIGGRLTPARIDMLRIVYEHQEANGEGVSQGRIQELLDVHPSVISRMLKRLREIGYVEINPKPTDLRCNIVSLTELGQDAIAVYLDELGTTQQVEAMMNIAFYGKPGLDGSFRQDRLRSYKLLNQIRLTCRDRAPFLHPWTIKDIRYLYNHSNREHPFEREHWSALKVDDQDDEIATLFRIQSDQRTASP